MMPSQHMQCAEASTENFLQHLRNRTASLHQRLEQTKLSAALLQSSVGLADYRGYLRKMAGVIRFCETKIFPLLKEVVPDIEQRRKLHLIEQDLQSLGGDEEKKHSPFIPFTNATKAFALGYFYVVEGSTLGGRVILKHLRRRLTEASASFLFFEGYGKDTGMQWKTFLNALLKEASLPGEGEEIVKGACHAFESIYHYFEE